MRIGVDIDDTICYTKELQKIYWKEYYLNNKNDAFTEELPKEINYFGIPYIDEFWDTYRSKLFSPKIKNDVAHVIDLYTYKGFEFVIITSRPDESYDDLKGQIREWMDREAIMIKDIYTNVRDKATFMVENNIDLLIDDDIRHINKAKELGKDVIHFTDDLTWLDVYDLLKRYL